MAYGDLAHCDGNGSPACERCARRDPPPATNTDPWYVQPAAIGDSCLNLVERKKEGGEA